MDSNLMTGVLIRTGKFGYSRTDRIEVHVKMEAEIGVTLPHAKNIKDCYPSSPQPPSHPQKLEEEWKDSSPYAMSTP